jgi:lipopolysaccharide export system protein LptA
LVLALATSVAQAAAGFSLRLRADPDRAPADGKSSLVLLVEVLDALGRPAPDGTMVYFVATLGQVVSPVQTIGGLAQTTLTASNVAGRAMVSAMVGPARQSIQVEFLAEPGSGSPGSHVIELEADEVAYSADKQVFVATWQARLEYRGMEIRADGIQYDLGANLVCAQGNVALQSGGRTLHADALRYELVSLRGRLLRIAEPAERLLVEGSKLETRRDKSEDSVLWEPLRTDETRTWVKARRAVISPGEKVILDHAAFYVGDTRVMALRRHVVEPGSGGAVFGQALGFSSASGVSMDFPMYYRASAHHIGSLHLTRNRGLAVGEAGLGWLLGLREEYMQEGRSEGALQLDDLFRPDRGLRWEHRQQFGGGLTMSLDASAVRFGNESSRLRSSSISLFRPLSAGQLSLVVSRSDYAASEQSLGDLEYRWSGLTTKQAVSVTPAVHLRQSRLHTDVAAVVLDPETGEPLQIAQQNRTTTSPGVDVNVSLPSKDLGRNLRLTAGMTTGYAWELGGGAGGLLDGRVSLDRRFGPSSFVTAGYTYSSGGPAGQTSLFQSSRQLLSFTGVTRVKGAAVRANLSQDPGGHRRFGSLFVQQRLPFGKDQLGRSLWNLELSHVFSRLDSYRAANTRLSLGRVLGRYRAALCYSPQGVGEYGGGSWLSPFGYGYTYSGGRHIWLELGARAF